MIEVPSRVSQSLALILASLVRSLEQQPNRPLVSFLQFGGGRAIESGEMLETPEAKEANEKHSRELISAYKKKMGLLVDTKTRAECEKSDLHGLAALQWSICQDSLCRPNEARIMYEKLKFHPNAEVSKKARQFVFSFQAMEMMKVKDTSLLIKTGYEDYFEVFVDKKISCTLSIEEQNERG